MNPPTDYIPLIDLTSDTDKPVVSGHKFKTPKGITAIKNGVKASRQPQVGGLKKPDWLRVKVRHSDTFAAVEEVVRQHRLSTVCEEAICPNISECWGAGTATIMLMGDICTRACQFCAVDTGNPNGWLDPEEPASTARAARLMGLNYLVLTSVNRDDIADGGAAHFAEVVTRVLKENPAITVEALVPDFQGVMTAVATVLDSGIQVFAQNIETVRRLTHPVRDPRASYQQTLAVLAQAKAYRPEVVTKTSLMLGLGETDQELLACMDDLRAQQVDILTLGQYLQPTPNHLPVERYISPEQFKQYRAWGLQKGFREVVAGAMVRSSYKADQAMSAVNTTLAKNRD